MIEKLIYTKNTERADFICVHPLDKIAEDLPKNIIYALEPNEDLIDGEVVINADYEKEVRLQEIEVELQQADTEYETALDTAISYTNTHLYKPKWAQDTYISLLTAGSLVPTMFPMLIWDATELETNAIEMTLEELTQLTMVLANVQQTYFNERKAKKSALLEEKELLSNQTSSTVN